jgi:phenylacetate-coenzyme A ligase PaaK-like adenylate-forming protein
MADFAAALTTRDELVGALEAFQKVGTFSSASSHRDALRSPTAHRAPGLPLPHRHRWRLENTRTRAMNTMADYESTRRRHRENAMVRLPAHLERLGWSAAQLHDWRTDRLRELLAIARDRSAWHRTRLASVDIEHMDEERLRALPPMTKDDLMAHFDAIVTDPRVTLEVVDAHIAALTGDAYLFDELHAVASGGSSGVRGAFVWGWDAWAEVFLSNLRRLLHDAASSSDLTAPPVLMLVAAENASHFTSANPQTFRAEEPPLHRFPVTMPLAEIVDGLNRVDGTHLITYASMLGALAAEARAGRLRIRPRRVASTAEPLLPEIRAAAEDAWQAPVANLWGTSEGGIVATGCFRGPGMHVNDDLLIVEPVDARGEPVAAGVQSAKIYLTNLVNPLQPLIRYELTDQVTPIGDPCACGSAYRRIADIQGRLDDVFNYRDGVALHPHVFRSVLGRDARIIEYQVRQTTDGAEVLLRAHDAVPVAAIAHRLETELARAGLPAPAVTARVVDGLPRLGTGKVKRFVPL